MLREAGINEVGIGLESGSDRVLKEMNKASTTYLIEKMNDTLGTLDIDVTYYIIIAFPTERLRDVDETIKFIGRLTKKANIGIIGSLYVPGYLQRLNKTLYLNYGIELAPLSQVLNGSSSTAFPLVSFSMKYTRGMTRQNIIKALNKYDKGFNNMSLTFYHIPPLLKSQRRNKF